MKYPLNHTFFYLNGQKLYTTFKFSILSISLISSILLQLVLEAELNILYDYVEINMMSNPNEIFEKF